MDYIKLSPEIVSSLHYLRKHLFDNPATHPTDVPKISPNGTEIKSIDELSKLMGVETKVAAYYALQDPNASTKIKEDAREAVSPGIYVAREDAFDAILHQAYNIATKDIQPVEKKRVRAVRTVSGVRKFRQPRGSIIVYDGQAPLDALIALPNDVTGYQKVSTKNGQVFYVGHENGKWVVRDPKTRETIFGGKSEEEAFSWLNSKAGGSSTDAPKEPSTGPVLDQAEQSDQAAETERQDRPLSDTELGDIRNMESDDLNLYKKLRQRGLSHSEVLALLKRPRKDQKK